MSDYYDELGEGGDAVRWAGWRHRIAQALRFEVALEAVDLVGARTLLDVGCGPGALSSYVEATGRDLDYLGIDRYVRVIEHARQRHFEPPRGQEAKENLGVRSFEAWDVFDGRLDGRSFDAVVAVGTLVSGEVVASEGERQMRLRRLVERLSDLAAGVACLVVLDQDVLESRPLMTLDPALMGARETELTSLAREMGKPFLIRRGFLETELAIHLLNDEKERDELSQESSVATIEKVLQGPWSENLSTGERAWLWLAAGYPPRAAALLDNSKDDLDELAQLIRQRLALKT
ncbi:MAG: class I SAM-dependent methyltransferase [Bradymonadaceae bacterium]